MVDAELIERAKLLLDRLSEKPRFAGSLEEAQAREMCKGELQGAGFACRELLFEYSQSPGRWGPALAAALQAADPVQPSAADPRAPTEVFSLADPAPCSPHPVSARCKASARTDSPVDRSPVAASRPTRAAIAAFVAAFAHHHFHIRRCTSSDKTSTRHSPRDAQR